MLYPFSEFVALSVDQRGSAVGHSRVQRAQLDARPAADRSTRARQTFAGRGGRGERRFGRLRGDNAFERPSKRQRFAAAAAFAAQTTQVTITNNCLL